MSQDVRICHDCGHPLGDYGHPERWQRCSRCLCPMFVREPWWRRLIPDWM